RSPPLDYDVDRQPMQPGGECRVPAKLAELLPGADEDILCGFVGFVRTEHPARQTVNPRHVRAVEPLERGRVPMCRKGNIRLNRRRRMDRILADQRHHRRGQGTTVPTTTWMGRGYERLTGARRARGCLRYSTTRCEPALRGGRPHRVGVRPVSPDGGPATCARARCRRSKQA